MTSSPTDEMITRIAAQSAAKREEFLNAGASAFKESDRGKAHAARVAAEREAHAAREVHFTEDEFFMLEAADQLGFVDVSDEKHPEMLAGYAEIVAFGLACQRAALLSVGCNSNLIANIDTRIKELSN